jgi:hypothetical protein
VISGLEPELIDYQSIVITILLYHQIRSLLQHLSPTFWARYPSWVPLIDVYFITPDGTSRVTFGVTVGFDPFLRCSQHLVLPLQFEII